jgi:Uma2 family endonuclease
MINITAQNHPLPEEQRFVLYDLDWASYRKISDALTPRHLRLSFHRGTLELCKVSAFRGHCARLLSEFVSILTEELNRLIMGCRDMTCEREDLECAIEADESIYLENERRVRHKEQIDLAVDPPPDLAMEIDLGRRSRARMRVYAALGVPEVWRFDGESVGIHQRGVDGQYVAVEYSPHFPFVGENQLLRFLQLRTQMDDNALVRSFRDWVREQIRTRG